MDDNLKCIWDKRIKKTADNLTKNNMEVYFADKKSAVAGIVKTLLNDGDVVTSGGSMSLAESGVIDLLRSGEYEYLDRVAEGADADRIYRQAFSADAFLCSCNAVTENGELYNVDGNSNRVAAICFGPKSVIMVVGYNKIVKNIDEAVMRVKSIAAPSNCKRLSCETYCVEKGECMGINGDIVSGCKGDKRICCNYLISSYQRIKGRIKIILVGEELGY